MSKKTSVGVIGETSNSGTLQMMQQDILGHKEGVSDKIERLQETLELLLSGMEGMMNNNEQTFDGIDKEYKEEFSPGQQHKGVFRNPIHAAFARQKADQKLFGSYDDFQEEEKGFTHYKSATQSLKHLKLSFPTFKEGSDPVEWLRDCEEYFSIYEVEDKRRATIDAMHLTGVPRSWCKSFMLGHATASWL